MSDEGPPPPTYKPGDIANGHVLTADGRWIPVGPASPAPAGTGLQPAPGWGQPTFGQQPIVFVQADNSNNSALAPVTSLVSGLVGLAFCWIPIIGIVGWIFAPVALVFGVLGVRRGKAEHKIMSWIGMTCGAITLVVCLAYFLLFFTAFSES